MGKRRIGQKRRFSSRLNEQTAENNIVCEPKTSKTDNEEEIIEIIEDQQNEENIAILEIDDSNANIPTSSANCETVDTIVNLLCTTNFILIQGPFGCGKTHSAQILSERRGLPLHTLQINDQYDSKILYGSYICIEVPGEFIWQESKFAKYITKPCIILLENVDHGGSELTSTIISLVENGRVNLPNGKTISIHKECQIIATISLDENDDLSKIPLQLREYPFSVKMPELSEHELNSIIAELMPRLNALREKLIRMFFDIKEHIRTKKTSIDRSLNAKDLFRATMRLQKINNLQDNKLILMELLDVWAMHLTNQDLRRKIGAIIAEALSLADGELNYLMNVRQPEIASIDNKINFGRSQLNRKMKGPNHPLPNFVLTLGTRQLIERIAVCVEQGPYEPILLTGETGVGKTSAVQYLASIVNAPLRVVNLNHDSEFTDLIGGYKPTSPTNILRPLADDYFKLFKKLFGEKKNAKFLENLNKCFNVQRFGDFLQLLIKSTQSILQKYPNQSKWIDLLQRARRLAKCFGQGDQWKRQLLFSYAKGIVTDATEHGHWLLVDEINLASAECLDVFMELLDPNQSSIHPDFRFFACMNHATDIGKRSLPSGIRSKFTEFFVSEITDPDQLRIFIKGQLQSLKNELVDSILNFYLEISAQFPGKFSLRTLSRTLSIAADQLFSCQRTCLVHGCKIAFSSQLGTQQRLQMNKLVEKHLHLGNNFKFPIISPKQIDNSKFILIENSAIQRGNELIIGEDDNYIFTPSVRANIAFLASIVATGKFPILMEGETSAGKTSLIIQLAKISGNRCYRINNHEHIDIQEYIGNYAPDAEGRLQFVEGILLRAVKNGDWIILDELNLAPSSVLEALNRLLDDNRELFVYELNTTIKAHPRFQLFATQNPVGTYAGRKRLSRAFLNRFIVIQCDSFPFDELPEIVHKRCGIAPIQADLMVNVLRELKTQRTISGMFTFSEGLMTLRDLFRWGNRIASLKQIEDWRQSIVDHGYFVLAARCRKKQDESIIVEVLERQLNRKIHIDQLFNSQSIYLPKVKLPQNIVSTMQLRRILIHCSEAWKCNEPVLLVGETGCGKTTAVHLFGSILSINCHEKTDAADLLGSIRPVTNGNGGFRWQDGIVLQAMRKGHRLLIDEISLAPDSVLERLNSLLEPQRTILLTDPGAVSSSSNFEEEGIVSAADEFQLVATMNPGNDHGKKELSKALRNRFTEIWCPQENDRSDLLEILRKQLLNNVKNGKLTENDAERVAEFLIEFSEFFAKEFNEILRFTPTTRDLVGFAELLMEFYNSQIDLLPALYHSIETNILDAIGVIPSKMTIDRKKMIEKCRKQFQKLSNQLFFDFPNNFMEMTENNILLLENGISIGPFKIQCASPKGRTPNFHQSFSLKAPTTRKNALRIARALYSSKPVMLEGSPGAGKSSLIMAIAAATNQKLVRLNLSEQTDLYDLFGTDIPVVGPNGSTPTFAWRDGPVLKAIKEGSWILLDEMNLASQSVLEGLNSCFDFRKNIFIAELNKTFDVNIDKCRFFACQNPHSQGNGRRALPKSFLNRFISIFVEEMTDEDFINILCEFCKNRQSNYFTEELISKMVLVNKMCQERIQNSSLAIQNGGPFEFNLRDLFRWVEAIEKFNGNVHFGFELIYLNRLKSQEAREKVIDEIFNLVFVDNKWTPSLPLIHLLRNEHVLSIGNVKMNISNSPQITIQNDGNSNNNSHFLMSTQMDLLEKLAACAMANWLVLLIGPSHAGKRSTLRILAELCGQQIERMQLNSGTDALDLLGSFEQIAIETIEDDDDDENLNENTNSMRKSNIRFEWVDSVFLRAFRDGHWLLVEDVNCCNSAVLDCLNSCLESADGELVLPVDEIKTIRRHPNFRVFFTMNPKNGQLSRSMRNRAVEIQFCAEQNSNSLWSRNIFDAITTIFGACLTETLADQSGLETRLLLQKLQSKLSQTSTQTLLNSAALMHAKMKWKEPISTEQGFQTALNVLLTFLDRNIDCQQIGESLVNNVETVPTEFPPLTHLPAPNFTQKFGKFEKQLFGYYERCFKEVSNNLFDDQSLAIVCTHLAEGMIGFIQKQCKYDKISIDHLLEDTFPELRNVGFLWRQISKKASNETSEGQSYMNALRSNLICKPFKQQQQIKQFTKKWLEENEFICYKNEEDKTLFGPLKEHLSKLFHLFASVFGHQTSASSLIPWKEPAEETLQQFTFLQIMSARIERIFTTKNEFGLTANGGTFYSHLNCNYLALAANKLLWGPLGYNKNILREVRIGQLKNCREQMEQTLELFWNLTFAQNGIKSSSENNWQFCQTKIIKNVNEEQLKILIIKTLDAIELLTPSEYFVDPFYFALRQSAFYELRMEKLNLYFQAMQQFLQLTVSKCFDFEGISSALLRMPNCSNFLKLLANAWNSTVFIQNKLTIENEFDAKFWNDNKDGRIYRGIWQHGEEIAYENNFQNSIIVPLRWCTVQLRELFIGSIYFQQNVENIQERDIQLFSAHLSNCIHTIDSMIDRICNIKMSNNSQLTLAIYPEIITPYLFLLNSLKISVSEFLREKQQKWKENYRFIELNFHPFSLSSSKLDDFLNWIFQQPKLLPQQKLQICLWAFSTNCDLNKKHKKTFIQWLIIEWEDWHEKNAKQKKVQFFVLKGKKSNKNEEEEVDEEIKTNEQIRAYLPDYSEANFDEKDSQSSFNGGQMHLNGDEINSALRSIYSAFICDQANTSNAKFPYLCLMQIMDQYKIKHSAENAIESNFAQLLCFAEIRNNLLQFDGKESMKMKGSSPTLNVYKESDPAALIQCLSALGPLLDCSNRLLIEFAENATLLQLKEAINIYANKAPADAPLMKHAAQLERILTHAEEWESISDRAHSMREQMIPLQTLLLQWRHLEVKCWNELVKHVQQDSAQLTVLVSFPLFKVAMEYDADGTNNNDGTKLLLMFLEWIQNSTLGDFETRLWTGRLLSKFLAIFEGKKTSELSAKINSIICHFEQFIGAVREKYSTKYKEIEMDLRNFIRVVRYTDLNLWSVCDSAKKAHVQLFRILRNYKEMYNESLCTLLLDTIPKLPEIAHKNFTKLPSIVDNFNFSKLLLAQMFASFGNQFEYSTLELLDFDRIDTLKQTAIDLLKLIKTDLNYEDPNGGKKDGKRNEKSADEVKLANEKMQGRALFERQQLFAKLLRTTTQFGLTSRRAQNLDFEALTIQTLAEIPLFIQFDGSEKINQLFRHVVAARNVFLRQFAHCRRQQQSYLVNQISVANLEHLHGIVQFGIHWLYCALRALEKGVTMEGWNLQQISKCFDTQLDNFNIEKDQSKFNHSQMSAKFMENRMNFDQIALIAEKMRQILCCCPKRTSSEFINLGTSIQSLQKPLGQLRENDEEYMELLTEMNVLNALIQQIVILHKEEAQHILYLPIGSQNSKEWPAIWHRDRINSYESTFTQLVGMIRTSLNETKMEHYFPNECQQICSLIDKRYSPQNAEMNDFGGQFESIELDAIKNSLLLHFQSIYKEIEQLIGNENAMKRLDCVKQLIGFIGQSTRHLEGSEKLARLFLSIQSSSPCQNSLETSCVLAKGSSLIFGNLLHYLREFICQVASFQAIWIEIGSHLLSKGFVNPIPNPEQAKGEDKVTNDGCGFGEGNVTADAKDVGDEVETMEQIEGLKENGQAEGENQAKEDQAGLDQQRLPEVDQPIDVEDDFAGNLEGLDEQERDGQEEIDEGEEHHQEDQANWDFGDVDEAEETQLDPKLWEPEVEDKKEKEMKEGGKEGAQELTDELAAAQDEVEQIPDGNDALSEQQQPQKNMEERQEKEDFEMNNDEQKQRQNEEGNLEEAEIEEDENGKDEGLMERDMEMTEQENTKEGEEQITDEEMMDIEEEEKDDAEMGEAKENIAAEEGKEEECSPNEANSPTNEQMQQKQPETIGVEEGMPNAGKADDERENDGDERRVEGASGGNDGDAQNQQENHPNISTAPQLGKNTHPMKKDFEEEKQKERPNEQQKGPESSNQSSKEQHGENIEEENNTTEELEPSDEQNFSAQATSTEEQARRTRKLFEANLQRLKKFMNRKGDSAKQNEEEERNTFSRMGDKNDADEIELDAENEQIGMGNAEEANEQLERNIFLQFSDKQNPNVLATNDGIDTAIIDKLCSEFDRMEKQQNDNQSPNSEERMTMELQRKWAMITESIAPLAAELTESLRTILEPTIANRLQGDYRTGKRLNMRRLITFIASDFRKDRIWLRRTKLAKRNYQICIAVDNSQSMQHNHMTEITCNALCMIQRALNQLEIGQLAICSFGSQVNLVNDFTSATGGDDPNLGIRILSELKFDHQRTDLAGMLSSCFALFKMARERSNQPVEQMLIILGDGRGVLTEGVERINKALTQLNSNIVTVLYLIMDSMDKSITQMRIADFEDGKCTFRPYMQSFPFQLFAIVKNTHSLPATMAEAVRQWFEYTSRS